MSQLDILAIGDIAVDAYIRLKDANVHCNINHDSCELCIKFASKIPYEGISEVPAVGNSANAAMTASKLGLKTAIISNVGKDLRGKQCIKALKKYGVKTKLIERHKNIETNLHYVILFNSERTILVEHNNYPFYFPKIRKTPKWIYISSLGLHSEQYNKEILNYLGKNPEVKLAFQPGTMQIREGVQKMSSFYKRSEVCAVNVDEAKKILSLPDEKDVKVLLSRMRDLGPKTVIITDGINGSYINDGKENHFTPSFPDSKPPIDRTGCGDSFFATFISSLILGQKNQEALMNASINSMSVAQKIGPHDGLLSMEEINRIKSFSQRNFS